MRREFLIIVGVLTLVGCSKGHPGPPMGRDPEVRTISAGELAALLEHDDRPLRLNTSRDQLPGELSAAMLPMLIDWSRTQPGLTGDHVVLHNVNYGGNPLEGTSVLVNAVVPLNGIDYVEWVLTPLGRGGRSAIAHHGQLRFVFRKDQPVRLPGFLDEDSGGVATVRDLVFSWEAWRSPGAGYDIIEGMDPNAYDLSLRVYVGSQRYLEDFLAERDWFCTRLRMPGGAAGNAELLGIVLALGDGVARETITERIAGLGADPEEWAEVGAYTSPHPVSADERLNLPPELRSYQSVLRSCASMAYYSVLVAAERMIERGVEDGVDRSKLDHPFLGGDEEWMAELAEAGLGGLFKLGPTALNWLARNPQAIPAEIPGRLDESGLVEREEGKVVSYYYSGVEVTPYGPIQENLLR